MPPRRATEPLLLKDALFHCLGRSLVRWSSSNIAEKKRKCPLTRNGHLCVTDSSPSSDTVVLLGNLSVSFGLVVLWTICLVA